MYKHRTYCGRTILENSFEKMLPSKEIVAPKWIPSVLTLSVKIKTGCSCFPEMQERGKGRDLMK